MSRSPFTLVLIRPSRRRESTLGNHHTAYQRSQYHHGLGAWLVRQGVYFPFADE